MSDCEPHEIFTEALLSRAYKADIQVERNPLNQNLEISTRISQVDKEKEAALLDKIC